jgi:hypothetical protein
MKLHKTKLLDLLHWLSNRIEDDDSFEGRLKFEATTKEEFEVDAAIRFDNRNGQGSMRLIQPTANPMPEGMSIGEALADNIMEMIPDGVDIKDLGDACVFILAYVQNSLGWSTDRMLEVVTKGLRVYAAKYTDVISPSSTH